MIQYELMTHITRTKSSRNVKLKYGITFNSFHAQKKKH